MIIKTLVEDTSCSPDYKSEHGFCLYIETEEHKLLFDLGASSLFLENALKMGVPIEEIDTVILSHGHYDHGGGLKTFFEKNNHAKVYIHSKAFDNHYSKNTEGKLSFIGIDASLASSDQIVFTGDSLYIDQTLELFSGVTGREFFSSCNNTLYMENRDIMSLDIFQHEQNLIITENDTTVLIAGCAHNGIVNIIKHYYETKTSPLQHVIGGFHLYNYGARKSEDPETIRAIGEYLMKTESKYYTGHCTGPLPYQQLKSIMGDHIEYLSTGNVVKI